VSQQEPATAERGEYWLYHTSCELGGDGRIEGVAALHEHLFCGGRGNGVSAGDCA
jgi:hypothetical protein